MIELIENSFKDPNSSVYQDESGKIYRSLSFPTEVYNQFDFFSKILSVNPQGLYEIEKIPFILSIHEFSLATFIDSGLFYLRCLKQALNKGYSFNDASPSNLTYLGNGEFKMFDLGSLIEYNPNLGWEGYKQFITEWIYPILLIHDKKQYFPNEIQHTTNNSEWYYLHEFSLSKRINPKNNIYFNFINQSKKKLLKLEKHKTSKNINKNQILNIIALLESTLEGYSPKLKKSKWSNYYSNTVLQNGYPQKKMSVVEDLIKKLSAPDNCAKPVICDWGSNTGEYSKIIAKNWKKSVVISVESDHNAIIENWWLSKTNNMIPCFASVLNPTPANNFGNSNQSLLDRIKKCTTAHVALGLIHHMQHELNLSYEKIIDFFYTNSLDDSHLVIEYIDQSDERYQVIENPNYPHGKQLVDFENAIKGKYNIHSVDKLSETRILYHAQKI
jgi:hypothetical protein